MKPFILIILLSLAICLHSEPIKTCKKLYTVREYNTCATITKTFGISTQDLEKMNTNLNCKSKLTSGAKVCVSIKDQPSCKNIYKVSDYNTCDKIQNFLGSTREQLHRLNNDLDCSKTLSSGKQICISEEAPKACKKIYTVREYDTCSSISKALDVSTSNLAKFNVNLDCKSKLTQGRSICVSDKALPSCKNAYKVVEFNTCQKIQDNLGPTREELHRLNNDLDCSKNLPKGKDICISSDAPKSCKKVYTVREFTACSKIAEVFDVKLKELVKINVNVDCSSKLSQKTKVCVSLKDQPACKNVYKVARYNTCDKIQDHFGSTREQLHRLNNDLDCSSSISSGTKICISDQAPISCKKLYTVREYTSCSAISNTFSTTSSQLTKINVNLDCKSKLAQLRPICVSRVEQPPCLNSYNVSTYNTCQIIQDHFGSTREQLHRLNNDLDCSKNLTLGQPICISEQAPIPCKQTYVVKEYENCTDISTAFSVSVENLISINVNLDCKSKLAQGREICVVKEESPTKTEVNKEVLINM